MKKSNLFLLTLLACLLFTSCGSDNAKMTGKGIFGELPQYLLKYYEFHKQCADELEFEDNKDKRGEIATKYEQMWDVYRDEFFDKKAHEIDQEVSVVCDEQYGISKAHIQAKNIYMYYTDKSTSAEISVEMDYKLTPRDSWCFFLDKNDSIIAYTSVKFKSQAVATLDFYSLKPSSDRFDDYLMLTLYALDKVKKVRIATTEDEIKECMQSYFRNADMLVKSLHEAGIVKCNSWEEISNGKTYGANKAGASADNVDKTKPGAIDLAFFNLRGPVKSVSEKNDSYDNTRRYGFSKKGKWETQDGQKIGSIFTDVKRDAEKRIIEYTEGEYDCIDSHKITYDAKTGWLAKCETSAGDGESTTTYTYDANGYAVKSVTIGEYADDEGGSKVNTTTTYTYVSFDDYGNWTKRTAKDSDGSTWTETRKITYYK